MFKYGNMCTFFIFCLLDILILYHSLSQTVFVTTFMLLVVVVLQYQQLLNIIVTLFSTMKYTQK